MGINLKGGGVLLSASDSVGGTGDVAPRVSPSRVTRKVSSTTRFVVEGSISLRYELFIGRRFYRKPR